LFLFENYHMIKLLSQISVINHEIVLQITIHRELQLTGNKFCFSALSKELY